MKKPKSNICKNVVLYGLLYLQGEHVCRYKISNKTAFVIWFPNIYAKDKTRILIANVLDYAIHHTEICLLISSVFMNNINENKFLRKYPARKKTNRKSYTLTE